MRTVTVWGPAVLAGFFDVGRGREHTACARRCIDVSHTFPVSL